MATPVPLKTKEAEGKALAALFADVKQTDFAMRHAVPGGPSMLSQHIRGHRPITIDAALVYARGLRVEIRTFSPRLQAEVDRIRAEAANIEQLAGAAPAGEPLRFGEAPATYQAAARPAWPFRDIAPREFALLDDDDWRELQGFARGLIASAKRKRRTATLLLFRPRSGVARMHRRALLRQ